MKIRIAPSILAANLKDINNEIKKIEKYVNEIHIDVMDGKFVKNKTIFSPAYVKKLKTKLKKNVHLMIVSPEKRIKEYAKANSHLIIIHYEACKDLGKVIKLIKSYKKKVGVAINPETKAIKIKKYLDKIDFVLVMTVQPGKCGQEMIMSNLKKVKLIREWNKKIDVGIDGGINKSNINEVAKNGANVIIAANSIFKQKDYGKAILELKRKAKA